MRSLTTTSGVRSSNGRPASPRSVTRLSRISRLVVTTTRTRRPGGDQGRGVGGRQRAPVDLGEVHLGAARPKLVAEQRPPPLAADDQDPLARIACRAGSASSPSLSARVVGRIVASRPAARRARAVPSPTAPSAARSGRGSQGRPVRPRSRSRTAAGRSRWLRAAAPGLPSDPRGRGSPAPGRERGARRRPRRARRADRPGGRVG